MLDPGLSCSMTVVGGRSWADVAQAVDEPDSC